MIISFGWLDSQSLPPLCAYIANIDIFQYKRTCLIGGDSHQTNNHQLWSNQLNQLDNFSTKQNFLQIFSKKWNLLSLPFFCWSHWLLLWLNVPDMVATPMVHTWADMEKDMVAKSMKDPTFCMVDIPWYRTRFLVQVNIIDFYYFTSVFKLLFYCFNSEGRIWLLWILWRRKLWRLRKRLPWLTVDPKSLKIKVIKTVIKIQSLTSLTLDLNLFPFCFKIKFL